jgi:hypothetical protein
VEGSTTASNGTLIHPPAHPREMSFTASEIKSIVLEPLSSTRYYTAV